MLRELSVQNLALIEDIRVELEHGYCAWTGETGAGKSLLLTALGLVLGGKASAEMVRAGKSEARASAVFELPDEALRAEVGEILGGPIEDDQLILVRRISQQGRGAAQVNGIPVTVATLQRLGDRLVDIHGQNEGRALLDPDRQRDLLDGYGGHGALANAFREARKEHLALRRKRLTLIESAQQRERERALLEFERDELAAAAPRAGEYDELARDSHRMANAGALREAAAQGFAQLYEADHSAQGLLKRVARMLEPLARSVPELAESATALERLADETREVAYTLRDLGQGWEDDPERLENVETRLALYRKLAGRFHCKPDDLETRLIEVGARLSGLEHDDDELRQLHAPLALAWGRLKGVAARLTSARCKTARDFARAIQARFKPLGLDQARLSVEIETRDLGDDPTSASPPEFGGDHVEIMFLANPGELPRPLRKVASGGELSRVTLAAKCVLAGLDRVPTLVFDEIDTGVGGRLGGTLGKTLAELAVHHQVICVTHLPQMASYASRQWVIRKQTERGRTRTTISPLDEEDRVEELAAMLRGDSAAEGTRQEAIAMLLEARNGQGLEGLRSGRLTLRKGRR